MESDFGILYLRDLSSLRSVGLATGFLTVCFGGSVRFSDVRSVGLVTRGLSSPTFKSCVWKFLKFLV